VSTYSDLVRAVADREINQDEHTLVSLTLGLMAAALDDVEAGIVEPGELERGRALLDDILEHADETTGMLRAWAQSLHARDS